jgi:hypothetical protein
MGVPTVLSGIDPMIAMTLVEMGLEMEGVTTHRELENAYDHLLELQEDEKRDMLDIDEFPDSETRVED